MRLHAAALVVLLASACASAPARSSDAADRAEVLATVQGFFDVIASGDPAAAADLVVPDGVFVNVRETDGVRTLGHFSNADWIGGMSEPGPAYFEAFLEEPTVLVEGDVAVVWGRYHFDVDGERSHVGIDAFNLVRTDAGWRISGGAYTVER